MNVLRLRKRSYSTLDIFLLFNYKVFSNRNVVLWKIDSKSSKESIEPWFDGTSSENGFLYDHKWGRIYTRKECVESNDFLGSEFYNAWLNWLGLFHNGIVVLVLVKIDPCWGLGKKVFVEFPWGIFKWH